MKKSLKKIFGAVISCALFVAMLLYSFKTDFAYAEYFMIGICAIGIVLLIFAFVRNKKTKASIALFIITLLLTISTLISVIITMDFRNPVVRTLEWAMILSCMANNLISGNEQSE